MMINFFLAQENFQDLGDIGGEGGFGPWAEEIVGGTAPESLLATIMSNIIGAMTIGAGIWFLFQAIIAGYNYMNAAGDKARIENAGRRLTNSLIGIAVVVAAYGLLSLIGSFLGIEFLNLGKLFSTISPGGQTSP